MNERRQFLASSLCAGVSLATWGRRSPAAEKNPPPVRNDAASVAYRLTREVPTRLYDGERCWCHPRAGVVPGGGKAGAPRVVMTMNTLNVSGSDVFKGMFDLRTDDLGKNWSKPRVVDSLAPRYETIGGQKRPVALSDCWPTWHAASGKLLGTGHTVVYTPEWKVAHDRPRQTAYSVYDPAADQWSTWRTMEMPAGPKFENAGAGCIQRYDLADGSILLPIYFSPPNSNSKVTVARCTFDGQTLQFQEHGNEMHIDDKTRGLHEPSLTQFQGEFFLTIRNDKRGFVARSRDGLQFEPMQTWKFDDGADLGNYNTQQHWVTHHDALFLVYTRRGANNDHVFRHRAPLFMAQVEPRTLRVIRQTEQVLVPERGARLGNFGVTHVNEHETWVTVSEWMQTWGPNYVMPVDNKYGADGSVHVARIHWETPNKTG